MLMVVYLLGFELKAQAGGSEETGNVKLARSSKVLHRGRNGSRGSPEWE